MHYVGNPDSGTKIITFLSIVHVTRDACRDCQKETVGQKLCMVVRS